MLKLKTIKTESWDEPKIGQKYSPYVSFDDKQIPEVKDWEVGETYEMIIRVKQTSKNEDKDGNVSASFDIIAYKPLTIDDMSDEEFGEYADNAMK